MDPFGDDEHDFDMNVIVDRNWQVMLIRQYFSEKRNTIQNKTKQNKKQQTILIQNVIAIIWIQ